jgi:hypothetical protein
MACFQPGSANACNVDYRKQTNVPRPKTEKHMFMTEVRAARVEDDGEGRVDADIPKVLHIHAVLEHDEVALIIRAI